MDVKTIGVVGAGQLGTGISRVGITAGFNVIARDISEAIVQRCRKEIDDGLGRDVERGRLSAQEKADMMKRLTVTTDISLMKDADFVIEAALEYTALKQRIFGELDAACPPHTILTTNSSSIPITTIATATKRPEKCAKFHLWHPPQVLRYMEISRGYLTSDDTWATIKEVAKALSREPVYVVQDYAGGTNAYLQICERAKQFSSHWAWDLMLGTKTPQDLEAMAGVAGEAGGGLPPMASMDFIGIDTMVGIMEVEFKEYRHPQFAVPPLLRRMVEANHLGIKTGMGFYDYTDSPRRATKLSPYLLKFLAREEPQAVSRGGGG